MKAFAKITIEGGDREEFCPHPDSMCMTIYDQDAGRKEGWNIEIPYAHIERWRHQLKLAQAEIEGHLSTTRAAHDAREAAKDAQP